MRRPLRFVVGMLIFFVTVGLVLAGVLGVIPDVFLLKYLPDFLAMGLLCGLIASARRVVHSVLFAIASSIGMAYAYASAESVHQLTLLMSMSALLGSYESRHPTVCRLLGVILMAGTLAVMGPLWACLFGLIYTSIALLEHAVAGVSKFVTAPLDTLKERYRPLLAFLSLYLLLIVLYGLLFRASDVLANGNAFQSDLTSLEDRSLDWYLYQSTVTMTNGGPNGAVPDSRMSRLLVALESITGVYAIVILLQQVLRMFVHSSQTLKN